MKCPNSKLELQIIEKVRDKFTVADIVLALGCSRSTVYNALHRNCMNVTVGAQAKHYAGTLKVYVRSETEHVVRVPMTALRAAGLEQCVVVSYRVENGKIILESKT